MFANNRIKAIKVLKSPPKKKKCNSGYRSIVILFRVNKIIKKLCTINGILRWEIFEIIIVSIFPEARKSRNTKAGMIIVTIAT